VRKVLLAFSLLVAYVGVVRAAIYIEDGGYHLINDNTYASEQIYLDYHIANEPGTSIELRNGVIDDILLYNIEA